VYSEQNLKSDVRNVNTALGVDVPRTKPELPQAGPILPVALAAASFGSPLKWLMRWWLSVTLRTAAKERDMVGAKASMGWS